MEEKLGLKTGSIDVLLFKTERKNQYDGLATYSNEYTGETENVSILVTVEGDNVMWKVVE